MYNFILNYIEHSLILAPTVTGCISISAFASLLGIPVGITSSAIGLKICAIATTICLIKRLRLGLSHLRQHKFKHGFQDTLNPVYSCWNDVESTEHFLVHCPQFVNERPTLLSTLGNFNCSLLGNAGKVCFFEMRQLVQMITPRFLVLQLILSYQLKDLMNSFFK